MDILKIIIFDFLDCSIRVDVQDFKRVSLGIVRTVVFGAVEIPATMVDG